jgi:hypothetical protein
MKNKRKFLIYPLIALGVVLILNGSCKKKDDNSAVTTTPTTTPTTTNKLFINFTLNGVAQNISDTSIQISTGGGGYSYTSSGFFSPTTDININLSIPKDTILGSDLKALIGQKIPIGSCGGCPTNINLQDDINGNTYQSMASNNPSPTYYIEFTAVTFSKTISQFGQTLNQYYVTGTFNLVLSYGTDNENATNGTFGLIFQEVKNP